MFIDTNVGIVYYIALKELERIIYWPVDTAVVLRAYLISKQIVAYKQWTTTVKLIYSTKKMNAAITNSG